MKSPTCIFAIALLCLPLTPQEVEPEQGMSDILLGLTVCFANELQVVPRWRLHIRFDSPPEGKTWIALTEADYTYLQARITYDTTRIKKLRETVVHELWHILTWRLGELAVQTDMEQGVHEWEHIAEHAGRLLAHKFCVR